MAQPLFEAVPAFCLCYFGSDNKFDNDQVMHRWKWMEKKAAEYGVNILGFSGDADSRILKAMKFEAFVKNPIVPSVWNTFFSQHLDQS